MDPMMKLVVGWALVGAFVFTLAVTCMSLVGWIRFADKAQQRRLFQVLIVELVAGVAANAFGGIRLDTGPVKRSLRDQGANVALMEVFDAAVSPTAVTPADPRVLRDIVDHLRVADDPEAAAARDRLRAAIPEGTAVGAPAAEELRRLGDDPRFRTLGGTEFRLAPR